MPVLTHSTPLKKNDDASSAFFSAEEKIFEAASSSSLHLSEELRYPLKNTLNTQKQVGLLRIDCVPLVCSQLAYLRAHGSSLRSETIRQVPLIPRDHPSIKRLLCDIWGVTYTEMFK